MGVNIGELANAQQYSASVQWRYQGIENWRIYPKLVMQMRDYDDNRKQTIINPSLNLSYRFSKSQTLEWQSGLYMYDTKNSFGDSEKFQVNFVNLSYMFQF